MGRNKAEFLECNYVLSHFGNDRENAAQKYEDFIRDRKDRYKGGEYSGGGLIKSMGGLANVLSLRGTAEKEMSDERILGAGAFVENILKLAEGGQIEKMSHEEIVREIENRTGVTEKEILSGSRQRHISQARAIYCHLKKEKGGVSGAELMRELKISCGAVSLLAQKGRSIVEGVCPK